MPSRDELIEFLKTAQGKVGKREIAKAFGIKGGDRLELKALLADLAADGVILGSRKLLKATGSLPPVSVLEIVDRDDQGDTFWPSQCRGKPTRPASPVLVTAP
ncbi:MAG: hypothetical protein R3D67_16370 [Hyphomicrobiaceae bacterium]